MAKKKKGLKGGGTGIGKITIFYFSGDVGEFLDGLKKELSKPGAAQGIAEVLAAAGPAIEAASKPKARKTAVPR